MVGPVKGDIWDLEPRSLCEFQGSRVMKLVCGRKWGLRGLLDLHQPTDLQVPRPELCFSSFDGLNGNGGRFGMGTESFRMLTVKTVVL